MAPPDTETHLQSASSSKVHSLKAAIFHTMAFKLSLGINNNKLTIPTKTAFLKVLYNVCRFEKKNKTFEQYAQIHYDGTKIAICETVSGTVFVLHSAFTSKDNYFQAAIQEATDAFNKIMLDFGYHQKLDLYVPQPHRIHLLKNIRSTKLFIALLPNLHHL